MPHGVTFLAHREPCASIPSATGSSHKPPRMGEVPQEGSFSPIALAFSPPPNLLASLWPSLLPVVEVARRSPFRLGCHQYQSPPPAKPTLPAATGGRALPRTPRPPAQCQRGVPGGAVSPDGDLTAACAFLGPRTPCPGGAPSAPSVKPPWKMHASLPASRSGRRVWEESPGRSRSRTRSG